MDKKLEALIERGKQALADKERQANKAMREAIDQVQDRRDEFIKLARPLLPEALWSHISWDDNSDIMAYPGLHPHRLEHHRVVISVPSLTTIFYKLEWARNELSQRRTDWPFTVMKLDVIRGERGKYEVLENGYFDEETLELAIGRAAEQAARRPELEERAKRKNDDAEIQREMDGLPKTSEERISDLFVELWAEVEAHLKGDDFYE